MSNITKSLFTDGRRIRFGMQIFFLLSILAVLSNLLCGCCSSHDDIYRPLETKDSFVEGSGSISFRNQNEITETIQFEKMDCGFDDPHYGDECKAYYDELCGQFFSRSSTSSFVLDFSHTKNYHPNEYFYFSDCYCYINYGVPGEIIDSMQVSGQWYYGVRRLLPIPRGDTQSITEFYYLDGTGPLKYVLANGEIWQRLP